MPSCRAVKKGQVGWVPEPSAHSPLSLFRCTHLRGDQLYRPAGTWSPRLCGALTQLREVPPHSTHTASLQWVHPSAVGWATLPHTKGALLSQGEGTRPRGKSPPPCLWSFLQWGGPRYVPCLPGGLSWLDYFGKASADSCSRLGIIVNPGMIQTWPSA